MLGVLVLRVAGLATALRARESLNRGELPAQTMLEGLMMALAGGLLILPGFISDVVGLVMLLPVTRALLAFCIALAACWAWAWLRQRSWSSQVSGSARHCAVDVDVAKGLAEQAERFKQEGSQLYKKV